MPHAKAAPGLATTNGSTAKSVLQPALQTPTRSVEPSGHNTQMAQTNGSAFETPSRPSAQVAKSPAQPELSKADTHRLMQWLEKTDKPFNVHSFPVSRKRKRDSTYVNVQDDLFSERLSVQFEVRPRDKWESLRKYKRFTVGDESIAVGECILVKHDDSSQARIDTESQWKAKVLEVRALDTEHVYVRVAWLNRPEDLDGGRKPYHGRMELLPTNQMDVIDAMAVNGSFEITHWDEEEEDAVMMEEDQYFWRQTYDAVSTRTYSALRQICVDGQPQNPDETIVQCTNPECRKWLHAKCIAKDALQRHVKVGYKSASGFHGSTPSKHMSRNSAAEVTATASKGKSLRVDVYIKGALSGLGTTPAVASEVVLTNAEGRMLVEDVICLLCHQPIDDD